MGVDVSTVLALIAAALGSSVISAGITAVVSWRLGVRGDERQARSDEAAARRDTVADRDQLIDQYQEERKEALEERREVLERLTNLEREHALDVRHNRLLIDHIYRRRPPPPPDRPTTL